MEQSQDLVVRYFNDNSNCNFENRENLIKYLIVQYSNNTKQTNYNNFDELIREICEKNPIYSNLLQNSNFSIKNQDIQMLIPRYFGSNLIFNNFTQNLMLQEAQKIDSSFRNYNDFFNRIKSVYCTLDGFVQYLKTKDISQMESSELEKIKNIFEKLPETEKSRYKILNKLNELGNENFINLLLKLNIIEKYGFDLDEIQVITSQDIGLALINQSNPPISLIKKNSPIKRKLQYLLLNNQEMPENDFFNFFVENYTNRESEKFIENPFARLYIFLQFGGNLYNENGNLDKEKLRKIISEEDYRYFQNLFLKKGINEKNYQDFPEICQQYTQFLIFYKYLSKEPLNDFDNILLTKYKKKPLEIIGQSIGWGTLAAVCGFAVPYVIPTVFITLAPVLASVFLTALALLPIALDLFAWPVSGGSFSFTLEIIPAIWTELFPILATAIPEVIPIVACSPITLAIAGALAAIAFVATAITIAVLMSTQNKELNNEFAPPTNKEEDKTKKIEISKEEDITQETQKEANQKNTNDVNTSLLIKIDKNKNKNSSDDSISLSSLSDENELPDSL